MKRKLKYRLSVVLCCGFMMAIMAGIKKQFPPHKFVQYKQVK